MGKPVLKLAEELGHQEIVKLLKDNADGATSGALKKKRKTQKS